MFEHSQPVFTSRTDADMAERRARDEAKERDKPSSGDGPAVDLTLLFLPQWSPFQPPLSVPSLTAWMRRAGYAVSTVDANILLYHWLLSDECAGIALRSLDAQKVPDEEREALRGIIEARSAFRGDLFRLKDSVLTADERKPDFLLAHYTSIKSFNTYLGAISAIATRFTISPYDFHISAGLSSASLEEFADDPPPMLLHFMQSVVLPLVARSPTRIIGLSCIGQEQLPFAFLFGRLLKEATGKPVIVGGTILSRIFERGILQPSWMRRYLDVIVRNEGERPCEAMLRNVVSGEPLTQGVPGIVFLRPDGGLCSTEPAQPLRPAEIPIPDFDDLPLAEYVSAETTLPLLSSRGCYWGKCEFCHHFMVYGESYMAYKIDEIRSNLNALSRRYGCKRFAFNDEAVPPKIMAALGRELPDHHKSGFTFTGLIKFEKYFTAEHFTNLARVGFRSLYIGLESASERVLALMRKPNSITTITRNLRDASAAGIWTHCFLFFGFPGETEDDAKRTYDFILKNPHIVGSFGCGEFSLEHNAPIQKHLDRFGVTMTSSASDISVYYSYATTEGISAARAVEWRERLTRESRHIGKYRTTQWIPREFLLSLISAYSADRLVEVCIALGSDRGMLPVGIKDVLTVINGRREGDRLAVNRLTGRVARARGQMLDGISCSIEHNVGVHDLRSRNPHLDEFLAVRSFEVELE